MLSPIVYLKYDDSELMKFIDSLRNTSNQLDTLKPIQICQNFKKHKILRSKEASTRNSSLKKRFHKLHNKLQCHIDLDDKMRT